jgi:phosphoribosylamine---glycine ligase
MNILFVSGELIAGDLALQLQHEGNNVKLYIAHPTQQACLDGFAPKTGDWESELGWIGKDGLIVFDDVGYGEMQDRLRREGYRVVGGSAGGDRLERDRAFAQQLFGDCGMTIAPNHDFDDAGEAMAFVKARGGAWVVKQNDHQSHLNYVGEMEDGGDVLGVLANYRRLGIGKLTLQRRLSGVEIGVARYFNGRDWVGPIDINQEHKGLMNEELGPKTGEMGTLMWFTETSRLFDATLGRLKDYLTEADFRGEIDINCFVDGDTVYPIEATARFGCPSTHLQTAMYRSPWTELLCALADGRPYDLEVCAGYGIVLTMAVAPFPYDGEQVPGVSSIGLPLLLRSPLTEDETRRLHLEGVAREHDEEGERTVLCRSLGWAMFVSGTGTTVEAAQHSAYALARKIVIPKVMYRTDIGDRFLAGDRERLQAFCWI